MQCHAIVLDTRSTTHTSASNPYTRVMHIERGKSEDNTELKERKADNFVYLRTGAGNEYYCLCLIRTAAAAAILGRKRQRNKTQSTSRVLAQQRSTINSTRWYLVYGRGTKRIYAVWSSEHLDNLTSPTAPSKTRSYTAAAEPSATRALSSEPGPGCSRHHLEHPTSPTIHYFFVVKVDHRRANTEPIMKSPQGWPSPPDCDGQQEQQQYLDTRPIPWVPAPGKSSFAYHTPTTRLRTPGTW